MIIDALLPLEVDADKYALDLAEQMGAHFTSGEMVAQIVRFTFEIIPRWRVNCRALNIRESPSTDGKITGALIQDETIVELERHGDWVRHKIGWSHSAFLKAV